MTDANGDFVITRLSAGDYYVRFSPATVSALAPRYFTTSNPMVPAPVTVTAGTTTTNIDAVLTPGGRITGRVTDSTGAPVANAGASAWTWTGPGRDDGFYGWTTTGADGRYSIPALAAADYIVTITPPYQSTLAPEYYDNASTASTATLVPVETDTTFEAADTVLEPGGTISGRVTDRDGAPLQRAFVTARTLTGPRGTDGFFGFGSTDEDGRYIIAGLAAGDYQVQFSPPMYSGLSGEFFDNRLTSDDAVLARVVHGEATADVDAMLTADGPPALPLAPIGIEAAAGDASAIVSWSMPVQDAPVSSFEVTANPGQHHCTTVSLTCTVDGLTNGTTYTFTVRAKNDAGSGPASAPRTVTLPSRAGDSEH